MDGQSMGTLVGPLQEAAALARAQGQPAYVLALAPEAGRPAMAVLWPEILVGQYEHVLAIVLPGGELFTRWGVTVE